MISELKQPNKILCFVVAISPILDVYSSRILPIGIGSFCMLLFLPYMVSRFCNFSRGLSSYSRLMLFCFIGTVFSFLSCAFNGFSLGDIATRILVMFSYVMLALVYSHSIDERGRIICYYKVVAVLVSIIMIFQFFCHYVLGTDIFFLLKNIPYSQSSLPNFEAYRRTYTNMYTYSYRPTSVFLEPSHFALYVAPATVLFLKDWLSSRKNIFFAIVISIALVFSTSLTGYFMLFIAWSIMLLELIKKGDAAKTIIIVLGIIVIAYVLFHIEYRQTFLGRLTQITTNENSSAFTRISKGWRTYASLSPLEWFMGIGLGAYDSYVLIHGITDFTFEYMNSLSYVFVSTGLIGGLLFLSFVLRLFKTIKSVEAKIIVLLLLAGYFSGSILFSIYDTLYLIIIYQISRDVDVNSSTIPVKITFNHH